MSKKNKKGNGNKELALTFLVGIFILFSFHLAINKTHITGLTVAGCGNNCDDCSCSGIRYIDLKGDYSFLDGTDYEVIAEVYKGNSNNPNQLIDSETINFNSIPEYDIDDNPGTSLGNLIIEEINESSITIRFQNTSSDKLKSDNNFQIKICENSCDTLSSGSIHLSCSEDVNIEDIYGDFEIVDIDKILSGDSCNLGMINLISPANNSNESSPITFSYSVYDSDQSIAFCELIIDNSVYQTDYSITEIIPQYFNQSLANGTYEWSVNCTTFNEYEIESEKRIIKIGKETTINIKGVITDSNYNPVPSEVNVYDSEGQKVLDDDEDYDFYLGDGLYNVEVMPETGNFKELNIYNLTVDANVINFTRLEDSSEDILNDTFVNIIEVISWEVNPSATYDKVEINLSYGSGSDLALWKCTDFDFDNQTCRDEDNWTIIQNVPDGPNEIVFELSSNDPVVAVAGADKPPITTLNYPPNNFIGYTNTSYTITFNCTAEDKQGNNKGIQNITLYLTNSFNSSFSLNETIDYSGDNEEETALFNKTLAPGNYTWNCLAHDEGDSYDWGDINRSLEIKPIIVVNDTTPPIVTSISPINNTIDNDGYVTFQYNVTDNESDIDFCELIIDNSVVDTDYSITESIPQSFNKVLTNGNYEWSVNCTNVVNLTGSSETRTLIINITSTPTDVVCCGVTVSTTPEVSNQGDKVLVSADVVNLINGLAATPSDLTYVNATIYRVDNGSYTTIVDNIPMTFLNDGLWYYEFNILNNVSGSYIASVTMLTNQTTPFIKEASDAFTIGVKTNGLTVTGVSPDLININQTTRLAAEIKNNGIVIDASLISNENLIVEQINGTTQNYTPQINDGIIYVDGIFNETGIYYLDWTASYLNQTRTAREIVVVVGWEVLLEDINETVNVELLNLIKDNRIYLIELLTDMEYLQQFSEEEIFLITDSVNSMSKVINFLQNGEITNKEAENQFNQIKGELENKLGIKLTGSAIGINDIQKTESPLKKIASKFSDWRSVMFITLLMMFAMLMVIILMLTRIGQVKPEIYIKKPIKPKVMKNPINRSEVTTGSEKRRYQIIWEKIKERREAKKINTQPEQTKTRKDHSKELHSFVIKAIDEGYSKGSIKRLLINNGWPIEFVDSYCDNFFERNKLDFKRKVYK